MQEASNQKVQEQINYRIGAERMLKALPRWAELTELLELVVETEKSSLPNVYLCNWRRSECSDLAQKNDWERTSSATNNSKSFVSYLNFLIEAGGPKIKSYEFLLILKKVKTFCTRKLDINWSRIIRVLYLNK